MQSKSWFLPILILTVWIFTFGCVSTYDPHVDSKNARRTTASAGGHALGVEHPVTRSVVLLKYSSGTKLRYCSGVLIATNMILTAAHCLVDVEKRGKDLLPDAWKIYFGTDPLNQPKIAALASCGVRLHPDFSGVKGKYKGMYILNPKHMNDLAVLKICTPAPADAIPLQLDPSPLRGDEVVNVAGYGPPDGSIDSLMYLRSIGLRVGQRDAVSKQISFAETSDNRQLTPGDSGAPVLFATDSKNLLIVGVASQRSSFEETSINASWIQSASDELTKE